MDSKTDRTESEPVEVYGLYHAGPLEVAPGDDGHVHIGWPGGGLWLDRHGADDLAHAVMEALA